MMIILTFFCALSITFLQMTQEIDIHRSVSHKHIVGFHGFFEDNDNVYILLELCRRRVGQLCVGLWIVNIVVSAFR